MVSSMTPEERRNAPQIFDESRIRRVARGSGHTEKQVRDLLARYKTMRDLMGQIGANAGGFLSRLPGVRQLAQLQQLKGMDLSSIFGDMGGQPAFAPPAPQRIPGLPPGYTPPMNPAMRARARAMGWDNGPAVAIGGSDAERKRLKEKRKRERQARKSSRKKKR
jgi:signal recognition particle subunit SRP54